MITARADVPQTDREAMIQLTERVDHLLEKLDGKDGICDMIKSLSARQDRSDARITKLENWRWYVMGAISIATFILVLVGRYKDFFQ